MALKLTVDSVEGLDDATKALYQQKDGKFVLDVDGIEDTSALKGALQKERKAAETAAKQVKRYEALGKTPEEIEELLAAHAKAEEKKATDAGEWDKLRAQMNEKHQVELRQKDETLAQMRQRLQGELIDSRAVAAIAAAKGIPDLLLPHVQRHVKVDDNYNVVVVDAKGDPRVNGKGEPLSISDLVSEMKQSDIFGRAFEGSGQSGSGMQPTNGGGNPQITVKYEDLQGESRTQREKRTAFIQAYGLAAYQALPGHPMRKRSA